jgi:hypothetical protein
MLMQNVVRLADRFLDSERQERLFSCVALVSVFYAILSMAFMKLGEIEKRHHIAHPDPDVCFELMIAPPPKKEMDLAPPVTSLDKGESDIGGEQSSAKKSEETKIAAVNNKAELEDKAHEQLIQKVESAPLNVASTNGIKHTLSQNAAKPSDLSSNKQSSNSELNNGSVIGSGLGTDIAGIGAGGIGKGKGATVGDGKKDDDAGGEKLPPVSMMVPGTAQGNIAPYRTALLVKLAGEWRPVKKHEQVVALVRVSHEGAVIEATALEWTHKKSAENAVRVLSGMQFDPLPDWYKGQELTFKIYLDADSAPR